MIFIGRYGSCRPSCSEYGRGENNPHIQFLSNEVYFMNFHITCQFFKVKLSNEGTRQDKLTTCCRHLFSKAPLKSRKR